MTRTAPPSTLPPVSKSRALGVLLFASLTTLTLGHQTPASAFELPFDWGVRLEPGLAFPVGGPANSPIGVGFGATVKGGIVPYKKFPLVEVFGELSTYGFSANPGPAAGTFGLGVGGRFAWRTDRWFTPWADLAIGYIAAGKDGSGTANAFNFGITAGVAFNINVPIAFFGKRELWVGPFLKFMTMTPMGSAPGLRDDTAAKFILIGASIEWLSKPLAAIGESDRDHDGIPNDIDKCPDEAEDKDGFEDEDGCPELDNDKDGVIDDVDKCPNAAGPRSTNGCPDADNDGIADADDKCPSVAGPADNFGCPKYTGVKVTAERLEIQDKIYFAYDKSQIVEKSFDILNQVVQALKDNPELRVRIEGHTDDKGNPKHNLELSLGRAQAVRDYLTASGINADRLEAKGYGSEQPIDTNKTNEGRDRNRRVEFVIIK